MGIMRCFCGIFWSLDSRSGPIPDAVPLLSSLHDEEEGVLTLACWLLSYSPIPLSLWLIPEAAASFLFS